MSVLPYENDRSLVRRVNGIYPDASGNVILDISGLGGITLDDCNKPGYPVLLDNSNHISINYLPGTFNPFGHTFQGIFQETSQGVGWYYINHPITGTTQKDALGNVITVTQQELTQSFIIILNSAAGDNHWSKLKIPYPLNNITVNWENVGGTPSFARVATSGSFYDLIDYPLLHKIATSGNYSDLNGIPQLARVATTGNYFDLENLPEFLTRNEADSLYANLDASRHIVVNQIPSQFQQLGGALYAGNAGLATNPAQALSETTACLYYTATTPGVYANFGGISLSPNDFVGSIPILYSNRNVWTVIKVNVQTGPSAVTSVNTRTGDVVLTAADLNAVPTSAVGAANGVAPLNSSTRIDNTYLDPTIFSRLTALEASFGWGNIDAL